MSQQVEVLCGSFEACNQNFLVFWSDIVKTHNELFRIDQR